MRKSGIEIVEEKQCVLTLPPEGFRLEKGGVLNRLEVAYECFGTLSPQKDNVVFVCHALTGDAHVYGYHTEDDVSRPATGWWEGMIGPGCGIDTDHYFVVCANVLGGCRGTTGPASLNPDTDKPYGSAFPEITVGDIVDVHVLLLKELGFEQICAAIGGSFGGMQVLEWAVRYPEMCANSIVVAAAASLNAQALAFDIVGRQAIVQDPDWANGDYYGARRPDAGLARARKLAHITYLSQDSMENKFGRNKQQDWVERGEAFHDFSRRNFRTFFQIESYLEHQGEKFINRFDANSYLHITRAMDDYDLAEAYGCLEAAAERVKGRVLLVSLSGDWLFTTDQAEELVEALLRKGRAVSYCHLDAPAGHDAFLTHIDELKQVIRAFMPAHRYTFKSDSISAEYRVIAGMVPQGARVLDLGCGNGELLALLKELRGTDGHGIDIDIGEIVQAVHIGQNVLMCDIDRGLPLIPDNTYDSAVLSETLQVVREPLRAVEEILRVAKEAVVAFPNFGYWGVRLHLLLKGTMPKGRHIPYEWYNTPNIHLFTLNDFRKMCANCGIEILETHYVTGGFLSRLALKLGFKNPASRQVIARIARRR